MFKTQDPLIFQHLADVSLAYIEQQKRMRDGHRDNKE